MSGIDMAIEFIEGGKKGCLWDIVAGAICGDCKPKGNACEMCRAQRIISQMENQIAQSGLDFMKRQAQEWVKYSVER